MPERQGLKRDLRGAPAINDLLIMISTTTLQRLILFFVLIMCAPAQAAKTQEAKKTTQTRTKKKQVKTKKRTAKKEEQDENDDDEDDKEGVDSNDEEGDDDEQDEDGEEYVEEDLFKKKKRNKSYLRIVEKYALPALGVGCAVVALIGLWGEKKNRQEEGAKGSKQPNKDAAITLYDPREVIEVVINGKKKFVRRNKLALAKDSEPLLFAGTGLPVDNNNQLNQAAQPAAAALAQEKKEEEERERLKKEEDARKAAEIEQKQEEELKQQQRLVDEKIQKGLANIAGGKKAVHERIRQELERGGLNIQADVQELIKDLNANDEDDPYHVDEDLYVDPPLYEIITAAIYGHSRPLPQNQQWLQNLCATLQPLGEPLIKGFIQALLRTISQANLQQKHVEYHITAILGVLKSLRPDFDIAQEPAVRQVVGQVARNLMSNYHNTQAWVPEKFNRFITALINVDPTKSLLTPNDSIRPYALEAIARYVQSDNVKAVEGVFREWWRFDHEIMLMAAVYDGENEVWVQLEQMRIRDKKFCDNPGVRSMMDLISCPGETYQFLKAQDSRFTEAGIIGLLKTLNGVVIKKAQESMDQSDQKQQNQDPNQQGPQNRTDFILQAFETNKNKNFIPIFLRMLCDELLAGMKGAVYGSSSFRVHWTLEEYKKDLAETILPLSMCIGSLAENVALQVAARDMYKGVKLGNDRGFNNFIKTHQYPKQTFGMSFDQLKNVNSLSTKKLRTALDITLA